MKRFACVTLTICLLLSGCGIFSERMLEPVTFYYLQSEYQFGQDSSVIVSEQREASGHRQDLSYLLALYLMGPSEEEHVTSLPAGTRIIKLHQINDEIRMELTETNHVMSDLEFTLACACLSQTCLGMTDAKTITITYRGSTVSMTAESLMLFDDSASGASTEETQ